MDNAREFEHAHKMIKRYHRPDSNYVLTNVTVVGGASPEGSVRYNEWLSHQRAQRIFDYIGKSFVLPDSITSFTFLGRDWEGLRRLVADDPDVPYRDDVLATLDEIIVAYRRGETESQGNIAKIKRVHGGVPYRYMYRHLFPTLRESKLVLTFDNPRPRIELPVAPIPPLCLETNVNDSLPTIKPYYKTLKPFYMALKTNMLFDILAVPNISAEFYLGKNLSVVANWMYGWWKTDRTHRYWRIYGGDLAMRWWFGSKAHEKPLTGHHLGVYGGVLTYDFEWGGRGYMGGLPGHPLWSRYNHYFGVEYGYSLPVSRRLNIDFTLGLGYLGGEYREYIPIDKCYVWQATKYRHWYGPTKAEISLVWLIGRGNYNSKVAAALRKGGDR